jgi:hypothetical protein
VVDVAHFSARTGLADDLLSLFSPELSEATLESMHLSSWKFLEDFRKVIR